LAGLGLTELGVLDAVLPAINLATVAAEYPDVRVNAAVVEPVFVIITVCVDLYGR
jgi:hypothetical protein